MTWWNPLTWTWDAKAARDWIANLAPVALSGMVIGVIALLTAGPWTQTTEETRVVFIGSIGIILAGLLGAGCFWLYGLLFEKLKITGPGGVGVEARFDDGQ